MRRSFQDGTSESRADTFPKRVIVDTDLLRELFSVCRHPGCNSAIDRDNIRVKTTGAAIRMDGICNNSHDNTWSSSKKVGEGKKKYNVVNVEMASYTLFTRLNISQVNLDRSTLRIMRQFIKAQFSQIFE